MLVNAEPHPPQRDYCYAGGVPKSLGILAALQTLYISRNDLTGECLGYQRKAARILHIICRSLGTFILHRYIINSTCIPADWYDLHNLYTDFPCGVGSAWNGLCVHVGLPRVCVFGFCTVANNDKNIICTVYKCSR